jgi:hypothetical protein
MGPFLSSLHPLKALKILTGLVALVALAIVLSACSGGSPGEIAVGSPAPDFSLPTSDGGSVALSDYVGAKPALLYFHMALG